MKSKEIGDQSGSLLGGTLLIAGTSIGAGMLALPIVTGPAGFYPALLINIACWAVMAATGLLFLEATLLLPDGANVLSITKKFLGRTGEIIGGGTFIFLYYCLMVAYLSGGAPLVNHFLGLSSPTISLWLFGFTFALIVWEGSRIIDRTNWILMIGLVVSYACIVGSGGGLVDSYRLERTDWGLSLLATPVLFSAFGFHNVVPSVTTYLKRDRKLVRRAIIIGSAIPLAIFILWQWLIIGSIPIDLIELIGLEGTPIGIVLQQVTGNPWISTITNFFAFFAIVTSILGVSLSMVDFLGDGLGVKRTGLLRLGLVAIVFVPPLLIAGQYPTIFISALGVAGGFGEALINCLIPIALVWVARYRMKVSKEPILPGGKWTLAFLTLFTLAIIGIETFTLLALR